MKKYEDGIVNLDTYRKAKMRILWILKEVNHDGDVSDWDMREILATEIKCDDRGIVPGWEKVFAPIIYATYGILHNKQWHEIPNYWDDPSIVDILNSIAHMNVKHTAGGSTIHHTSLEQAYLENRKALLVKINEIDPDIIIYGGTYYLFEDDMESINKKDIKHISAYHPGQRTLRQEEYVNRIIEEALR